MRTRPEYCGPENVRVYAVFTEFTFNSGAAADVDNGRNLGRMSIRLDASLGEYRSVPNMTTAAIRRGQIGAEPRTSRLAWGRALASLRASMRGQPNTEPTPQSCFMY